MAYTAPRETVELVPFVVEDDGVRITADVTVCLYPDGTRPTDYIPAVINDDGETCVWIDHLNPGIWLIQAKVGSVAVDCGHINII